jgi:hypothetical protein
MLSPGRSGSRSDQPPFCARAPGKFSHVLLLVVIIAIAPAVICALVLASKAARLRTPSELRGDWWPEFEREFRAYARRTVPRHRRQES